MKYLIQKQKVWSNTFILLSFDSLFLCSCYEFVVAERVEGGIDPDEAFPFSDVKENSEEGTPYRAVVMNQ